MQALDSVRILDFTQMMLGPFGTQILADLGADVIKVERPDGEWERGLAMMGDYVAGESAAFLAMNRNKRSLALDLKDARAREALLALGATCDVVVENFRPGVMDRLGLGYEDFRKVRPDIIFCSGSGWGQDTSLPYGWPSVADLRARTGGATWAAWTWGSGAWVGFTRLAPAVMPMTWPALLPPAEPRNGASP